MKPSSRLERIPPYLFAELERKIAAKKEQGVDVISLGIGDPDTPTADLMVEALQRRRAPTRARTSTRRTAAGRSSATPSPRSTSAASGSRSTRRPRSFPRSAPRSASSTSTWRSSTRATSPWRPTPATRSTPAGPLLVGRGAGADAAAARARVRPDLDAIEPDVRERARLMYLNYPNNPTGRIAPDGLFEQAVEFAPPRRARRARRLVHGDDVRRLRRPELPRDGRGRRTSASRSSRCPRATT